MLSANGCDWRPTDSLPISESNPTYASLESKVFDPLSSVSTPTSSNAKPVIVSPSAPKSITSTPIDEPSIEDIPDQSILIVNNTTDNLDNLINFGCILNKNVSNLEKFRDVLYEFENINYYFLILNKDIS